MTPHPHPHPHPQPQPHRIRVGIDVGGTFTDAVAVDSATLELVAQVKVPTSHHHEDGVAHGIVEALDRLLKDVGCAPTTSGSSPTAPRRPPTPCWRATSPPSA